VIDPMGGPAFWWPLALGGLLGYLLGSIPVGLLLTRWAGAGDLRAIGSGNIGATNVLRTGRKGLAAATLALDVLKGFLPAWIGFVFFGPDMAVVAAAGAVLGHCFPVWLGFRGGKGVGTAAGVLLALSPWTLLAGLAVFALAVSATRYVSLGSILAALVAPPVAWLLGQVQFAELFLLIALLVIVKHAGNLRRLLAGTESRLSLGGP
jgi:glycerol-3-phosphate acyltransferase PlsY